MYVYVCVCICMYMYTCHKFSNNLQESFAFRYSDKKAYLGRKEIYSRVWNRRRGGRVC